MELWGDDLKLQSRLQNRCFVQSIGQTDSVPILGRAEWSPLTQNGDVESTNPICFPGVYWKTNSSSVSSFWSCPHSDSQNVVSWINASS